MPPSGIFFSLSEIKFLFIVVFVAMIPLNLYLIERLTKSLSVCSLRSGETFTTRGKNLLQTFSKLSLSKFSFFKRVSNFSLFCKFLRHGVVGDDIFIAT